MKFRGLLFALLVLACAVPVFAVAQDTGTNTVSYNGISFSFPASLGNNVNIIHYPGDPVDAQQPGGPEVINTEFDIYDGATAPATFDAPAAIRVYRVGDFAGYTEHETRFAALQTLLAERPDLSTYVTVAPDGAITALPFLPVLPAAQAVTGRAAYVDTPALQGITYVTVYRQDVSPFVGSEFIYTFQGVSADSQYYVSALFRVNANTFPAEIPADFNMEDFTASFSTYLTDSISQLNAASSDDFTPSLAELDTVIQSFTFAPAPPPGEVVTPPEATPTEVVNTDPALGGLAGNWNLVSYGPAEAPVAVLPEAPITLAVSDTGVNGSAGCNTYNGSFQYNVGAVTFGEMATTKIACAENVNAQELAYLQALSTASAFQVVNGQLQITYDGGVLVYAPPVTLAGTSWNLVSYGPADAPQTVLPEAPITLIFSPDGIGGSGGCNTYFGSAQYDDTAITFSGVGSTLMACSPETVMTQENTYFQALSTASSYTLADNQLQITYAGGVLTFASAAPA